MFFAVGAGDVGATELVFGIVLVVLNFAIRQLSVDEVAQWVVGVVDALVVANPVAFACGFVCALLLGLAEDVAGGVEVEFFIAGFFDSADFVVNVAEAAASLIVALDEVAGFVVAVTAVDDAAYQAVQLAALCKFVALLAVVC